MSFNKYYIPEPLEFAKQVVQKGPAAVINRKIDSIIGNPISVQIFDYIYENSQGKTDAEVLIELRKIFPNQFNGIR